MFHVVAGGCCHPRTVLVDVWGQCRLWDGTTVTMGCCSVRVGAAAEGGGEGIAFHAGTLLGCVYMYMWSGLEGIGAAWECRRRRFCLDPHKLH